MRIAKNELTEYQKQIKYFAEEGYDSKEIAEKVGRTLSSVRSAIAYLKVKGQMDEEKMAVMRASRAKPQTDTLNKYQRQVKELLENGYTIKEIAQKLGKGYECIWHVQNKLKCKGQLDEEKMAMIREEREEAKREYQIQIKELSEEGYTVKEIAQKLGTTLNIIIYNRSILRANGQLDEEKMAMMRAEKAKLRETKKEILDLARVYLQKRKYEELVVTLEELDENMLEPNEIKTLEDIKDIVKRERSVAEQVETKKTGEER